MKPVYHGRCFFPDRIENTKYSLQFPIISQVQMSVFVRNSIQSVLLLRIHGAMFIFKYKMVASDDDLSVVDRAGNAMGD